jgi:hypothetical protein
MLDPLSAQSRMKNVYSEPELKRNIFVVNLRRSATAHIV